MVDKATTKNRNSRGLFVMFEGVGPTIFDSQVALHAREMTKWGIELEIWTFETHWDLFEQSAERLDAARELTQSSIRLFRGVKVYWPFSDIINTFLLLYHLVKLKPNIEFIHARADWTASVCGYVSLLKRMPVIWDCRGDAEAEFDFAYRPKNIIAKLLRWGYLQIIRWRTYHAARTCQKAIFVSEGLRERKGKWLKRDTMTEVIPCAVSSNLFYFAEELRQSTRLRLQYTLTDRVLLYSGGMIKYEGFPEYVQMFRRLHEQDPRFKFLVMTPYVDRAAGWLQELPPGSYKLLSVSLREMNAFYNAADFGTLLRQRNAVNEIASPIKFGEYCLSGLPVVLNDGVQQSLQLARDFGNLIPYSPSLSPSDLVLRTNDERKEIARKAAEVLSQEALAQRYRRLYSFGHA